MVVTTLKPVWGLSMWSLHILPVSVWDLSCYSGFHLQTKVMHFRLIGDSKLTMRVNVSLNVCLSVCVSIVEDWQPVQDVHPASHPVPAHM